MTQQNITERIVDHAIDTEFSSIDSSAVARAKDRLIDSFGVMMIGRHAEGIEPVVNLLTNDGGAEESTVVTYKRKLPMQNASFINSLIMRSYDFEAIDAEAVVEGEMTTPAHISGTTVPAALAVAEKMKSNGKDLLRALILADDITARALNASGFSVLDSFDSNGTGNVLGATTAAAILLGLSKEELTAAYTVAVNMMSGTMQNVFEKLIMFKFPIALSAKSGIFAAQLAQSGYKPGLIDPIGGARGYFDLYYSEPTPEKILHELGKKFIADVVIKPWPSCRATHGSINATLDALGGRTLSPEDIAGVKVHVSQGMKSFVGEGFEFGMDRQFQGAFSINFLVATTILYGDVRPQYFTPERMTDPKIGALLARIDVLGDQSPIAGPAGCTVEIELVDGTLLSKLSTIARGDYYQTRLSREEILNKYYSNVEFGGFISKKNADAIIEIIDSLESLDDTSKLMDLIS